MQDRNLHQRMLRGDQAALAGVYASLNPVMVRLAVAITGNPALTEDLTQEAWLAVFDKLATFRGDAPLRHWILRILANKARTRARQEGKRRKEETSIDGPTFPEGHFSDGGDWALPPQLWDDLTPERVLAGREIWQIVQGAILTLPATQQAILALLERENLSAEACGDLLGLSAGNVRVHLHRAREKIRRTLDAELADADRN